MLGALVALGMALVYRANRILNFAQGDLGLVPVSLAVDLILFSSLNYFLAFVIGLAGAVVVGAVVELAIIRRFFRAPRLILTVATIGLAQLLAFGALVLPAPVGRRARSAAASTSRSTGGSRSSRSSSTPTTPPRGSSPRSRWSPSRCSSASPTSASPCGRPPTAPTAPSLLGIPVGRLHTYVWVIATVLSFVALFLRAGITGLPLGSPVGLTVLLSALAALMLGRLTNLPAIAPPRSRSGCSRSTSAGTTSSPSARSTSTSAATS